MNAEEIQVLKGYEMALRAQQERLGDLADSVKVLNEAHIETQLKLGQIISNYDNLCKNYEARGDQIGKMQDTLDNLKDRATKQDATFNTLYKIVTYFITPAMIIELLYILFSWINGT